MGALNIALWAIGIVLIAIGYLRARVPWSRYRELQAQEANVARYEAWRGGLRDHDDGPTGASVAMAMYRRQAQMWGAVAIAGVVLVFLGFFIR